MTLEEVEYFKMEKDYRVGLYSPDKHGIIPVPLKFSGSSSVIFTDSVCKPQVCDTVNLFSDDPVHHRHRIELCLTKGDILVLKFIFIDIGEVTFCNVTYKCWSKACSY